MQQRVRKLSSTTVGAHGVLYRKIFMAVVSKRLKRCCVRVPCKQIFFFQLMMSLTVEITIRFSINQYMIVVAWKIQLAIWFEFYWREKKN